MTLLVGYFCKRGPLLLSAKPQTCRVITASITRPLLAMPATLCFWSMTFDTCIFFLDWRLFNPWIGGTNLEDLAHSSMCFYLSHTISWFVLDSCSTWKQIRLCTSVSSTTHMYHTAFRWRSDSAQYARLSIIRVISNASWSQHCSKTAMTYMPAMTVHCSWANITHCERMRIVDKTLHVSSKKVSRSNPRKSDERIARKCRMLRHARPYQLMGKNETEVLCSHLTT